jgi:tetratricopeptide (TPR) repeat protein
MAWFRKASGSKHHPVGQQVLDALRTVVPVQRDPDAKLTAHDNSRGEQLRFLMDAVDSGRATPSEWISLGSIYYDWSRYIEAYAVFLAGSNAFPQDVTLAARVGWTALSVGKLAEAQAHMERVVLARPSSADAHYGEGVVLRALKRTDQALESFRRTTQLDPKAEHAYVNLAVSLMDLGRYEEAESALRTAIELAPENPGNWSNLAVNLYSQEKPGAEDAYKNAIGFDRSSSASVDAFVGYASFLRNKDRVPEAISLYEKYLPHRPNTAGLTQLGMCKLHMGAFTEGWSLYEFRWLQDPLTSLRANLDTPLWQGQDIKGKTILVRAEQGVGDVFQFARYLKCLKAAGANVLFQGRDGMEDISPRFDGLDTVVNTGERLPAFDFYTNLMSLPRFFGNDPSGSSTLVPYIKTLKPGVDAFRARRRDGLLNVGIVWAGNPTHKLDKKRSIPFEMMRALESAKGVQLISLQKGDVAERWEVEFPESKIVNWGHYLTNFSATADAIGALDLVISVDTSVAHLAGALGAPLWILLPRPAEWRWMSDRDDCAWYPTARLFRQQTIDAWDEVIASVGRELEKVAATNTLRDLRESAQAGVGTSFQIDRKVLGYTPPAIPDALPAIGEVREGIFMFMRSGKLDEGALLHRYGEWHHEQLALLSGLVRLGQVVVESNSRFGTHTVALSRFVGGDGHVITFEPDPVVRRILRENLSANKVKNVTVLLGSDDASRVTLDIDELQLGRLDWLKLNSSADVLKDLESAESTLWRCRPKLFVNVPQDATYVLRRLRECGYQCWMHASRFVRRENFNRVQVEAYDDVRQPAVLAIPEEIHIDVLLSGCTPVS